jgi:hypothetical protein
LEKLENNLDKCRVCSHGRIPAFSILQAAKPHGKVAKGLFMKKCSVFSVALAIVLVFSVVLSSCSTMNKLAASPIVNFYSSTSAIN